MTYPRLKINLSKIRNNTRELVSFCHTKGISVTGISKVFLGEEKIARIYYEEGVDYLGDSRIENLKKMSAKCKFAIRTGEFTPYPNVILRAGVAF